VTTQGLMQDSFPKTCLRGLRDKDHFHRDQDTLWIYGKAFEPHDKSFNVRVNNRKKSEHYESSINWEDNAVEPFEKLSTDLNNASYGILCIHLEDLEIAKRDNPLAATSFDWERDILNDNPYHGNLLFAGNLPKPKRRELAGVIATYVQARSTIFEPGDYESELERRTSQIIDVTEPEVDIVISIENSTKGEHKSIWKQLIAFVNDLFESTFRA
jgi:hypothetical protein